MVWVEKKRELDLHDQLNQLAGRSGADKRDPR